jgi:hypothetical protein
MTIKKRIKECVKRKRAKECEQRRTGIGKSWNV